MRPKFSNELIEHSACRVSESKFLESDPKRWRDAYEHLRSYSWQYFRTELLYVGGFVALFYPSAIYLTSADVISDMSIALGSGAALAGMYFTSKAADAVFQQETGLSRRDLGAISTLLLIHKADYTASRALTSERIR